MKSARFVIVSFTLIAAATASAQDAMTNNWGSSWASSTINRNVRDTLLSIGGGRRSRTAHTTRPRTAFAPVRPGVRAASFPYISTATSRRAAFNGMISRLSRSDPATAKSVANEMAKHNFFAIYPTLFTGSPLRANDAADTLAAFLILGYAIVHGVDSTAPQEQAVRTQVAQRAGTSPGFAPANRTQLAEDLKLQFVVIHSGWQNARQQGSQRQYAADVAKLFQTSGIDLRALQLTNQGFVAR